MRFGGMIFKKWTTPEEWANAAIEAGYSAVYFPVDYTAPQKVIDGFHDAAVQANLVICEIGVWNNVLDPDEAKRKSALERAVHQLELADYVQANCCVNISGTYNPDQWDGPHPENFTKRAFDDVVASCQYIIDTAKPEKTAYSLEPMPWMYPHTPQSYLDLIQAIDRRAFAAHLDIVNVINSPEKYYDNTKVIHEWFDTLGSYICSVHAKDTILSGELTCHLSECRPGTGFLDYKTYLDCASRLDDRVCVMLEHMTEEQDYVEATRFVKGVAKELGIQL